MGDWMKTATWLYFFIFVAFFDLHAQYPMLSPFALSLGAAPSFIGLIMGMYSITHLPGNLLAGYGIDRFGSRIFIFLSLICAGIVLLFQAHVHDPWQLLIIRSISGFVLAFLSPSCLALLAKIAKDRIQQGKFMSGNGLVHTLASVVSPALGALLVAQVGFNVAFTILGWILIFTGVVAFFFIKDVKTPVFLDETKLSNTPNTSVIPWLFYTIPLALSCSQGILFFELPLMQSSRSSILSSGLLFSAVSLGALFTLSFIFLNRYSPYLRTILGCLSLALTFFGITINWPVPLAVSLFLIGMSKGVIFPALSMLLVSISQANKYGRIFSILSISFSIGAFFGPILAGQLRDVISPFFIAFLVLMLALCLISPKQLQRGTAIN